MIDTSPLQDKINALEVEIREKEAKINLLKDGIAIDKQALRVYKKGLEKLKEKTGDNANS